MEQFDNRLNQPPDPRRDFLDGNTYVFAADKLSSLDPVSGMGQLEWVRHRRKPRIAFNHMTMPLERTEAWEFPPNYPDPKTLPFEVSFVDDRTVRLRWRSRPGAFRRDPSPMIEGQIPRSSGWVAKSDASAVTWSGPHGHVSVQREPWSVRVTDRDGKVLFETHTLRDGKCMISGRPIPFSFCRRSLDSRQGLAASFRLFPGEKLYGCGESFTSFNKRGQSVSLCTQDAHGSQSGEMYKPVPFYLSSRGYGVFVHGSTPMTFDLGDSYDDTQVLFTGDDSLDLFVFIGEPREVLSSYTALTGRSPLPPLWSFGLWMSRISYFSEKETREVAGKLREHRIPCDVVHLDTGWFEKDWCCNYEFAPSRFQDARGMISDLSDQGFRISLWQLPYFAPNNPLYDEIVANDYAVRGPGGELLGDDAVLDFTNPGAVAYYQGKLAGLLEQGVGAIKVDFGEGAPFNGLYASGRSGEYEHNVFPLRYNKAAAEVTQRLRGYTLIWARSAWAGSQRYPIHWAGDGEASNGGMLGTLRGGLSLGLCGFSFWSHDAGGFFPATPRDLYRRWLPFSLLSSHSRCHGLPPTEPWEFDEEFLAEFRKSTELRYRLMPYIWAQAAASASAGHPMLRPLFFEFPEDRGSWDVDDQYLFGSQLLVAPLFEEVAPRDVYLPPGDWIDIQSGQSFAGPGWFRMSSGELPIVILGRGGSAIPMAAIAQHTGAIDWQNLELLVLGQNERATGLHCGPSSEQAKPIEVQNQSGNLELIVDPDPGRTHWTLRQLG